MEPTVTHRPGNKGRRYPADPPRVEEIVAVMRQAGGRSHGLRLRGLIVVLWRAGLRIAEAVALQESDLEPNQGALVVETARADADGLSAWTTGAGSSSALGWIIDARFQSARCSASSIRRSQGNLGRPEPHAHGWHR